MNDPHPVYPGGPSCNPYCPGEHSMYHDGYADGYATPRSCCTPDDGHSHWWGCIRCGVDRPASDRLREALERIEAMVDDDKPLPLVRIRDEARAALTMEDRP